MRRLYNEDLNAANLNGRFRCCKLRTWNETLTGISLAKRRRLIYRLLTRNVYKIYRFADFGVVTRKLRRRDL